MAIVKNIDANLIHSNLNDNNDAIDKIALVGETNSSFLENKEQQTVWIGGIPHDSISLTPFYEKKAKAFSNHKLNNVSAFSDGMALVSKPIAKCSHESESFNVGNRDSLDFDLLKYSNESFFKNLTNETQNFNSNFYKFVKDGETFTLLLTHSFIDNQPVELRSADTKVSLIKGNDYSSNSLSQLNFSTTDLNKLDNNSYVDYLEILTVDYTSIDDIHVFFISNSTDKVLGNNANTGEKLQNIFVWKLNGSSMSHGNLNLIDSFKPLLPTTINDTVLQKEFLSRNLFYCGKDINNNNVFLEMNLDPNNAPSEIQFKAYNYNKTTLELDINNLYLVSNNNISNVKTLTNTSTDANNNRNVYASKWINIHENAQNKYLSYLPFFKADGTFIPVCLVWNKDINLNSVPVAQTPFEAYECSITNYPNNQTSLSHYINFNVDFMGLQIPNLKFVQTLLKNISIYNSIEDTISFGYIFKDKTIQSDLSASNILYNMLSSYIVDKSNLDNNSFLNLSFITETNLKALDLYYNSTGNIINVIQPEGVKQLTYSANNWSENFFQSGIFTNCFSDSYNRNWGLSISNSNFTSFLQKSKVKLGNGNQVIIYDPQLKLHLLESSLPQTTSISLQNTNLIYTGTAIANQLIINAYDENSARMQTDVKITIEGGNMVFKDDNSSVRVVTTDSSNDTTVDVEIIGSGIINVSASFDL